MYAVEKITKTSYCLFFTVVWNVKSNDVSNLHINGRKYLKDLRNIGKDISTHLKYRLKFLRPRN